MNKKELEFSVSKCIFKEEGKLREFCHMKYFNLRNSVDLKILERVTLRLDRCSQAAVLILPWNVICHLKGQIFWAMYVTVLVQNQRGNRLVSGPEYHNFCAAWPLVFQVLGDLRSLED